MIIKNADVFEYGTFGERFVKKDIYIDGVLFSDSSPVAGDENTGRGMADKTNSSMPDDMAKNMIDASDCYAIPGLTDIHMHGCIGYDFSDGTVEAIEKITAYQASVGVTTVIPATMTLPENRLTQICRAAAKYRENQEQNLYRGKAYLAGLYLEGPFLSPESCGAQNPAFLKKTDQGLLNRLFQESEHQIRIVGIAPELPGALGLIRENADRVAFSLAHTEADYETALEAFAAGATQLTHAFNAMRPFLHREPGAIGAAMDSGAYAELICDNIHLHPGAVRGALRMFGSDRVIFVSDSMRATGMPDGSYEFGGQQVTVNGRKAVLADGTIAGSVTNLMDCVRTAVCEMQIPLETAIRCAAVNPAMRAGIFEKQGSITPGKRANLVLLRKKDLSVVKVFAEGIS